MRTLTCDGCGLSYAFDEDNEDDISNLLESGWDFTIWTDGKVVCPNCNLHDGKEQDCYDNKNS